MATKTKKSGADESTNVENAASAALEQAEDATSAIFAGYEDLTHMGRENFGALVRANTVLTQGLEAIGQEMIGYTRGSLSSAAEAATALLGAKTFQDVLELNNAFAKAAVDRFLASSARLSEVGVKVATEALEPLSARAGTAFAKFTKPLAA
jgi:phasin family protein